MKEALSLVFSSPTSCRSVRCCTVLVEDMKSIRLTVPDNIFAAYQAVIEEDEKLGALFSLGLELCNRFCFGRHRHHLCPFLERDGAGFFDGRPLLMLTSLPAFCIVR